MLVKQVLDAAGTNLLGVDINFRAIAPIDLISLRMRFPLIQQGQGLWGKNTRRPEFKTHFDTAIAFLILEPFVDTRDSFGDPFLNFLFLYLLCRGNSLALISAYFLPSLHTEYIYVCFFAFAGDSGDADIYRSSFALTNTMGYKQLKQRPAKIS